MHPQPIESSNKVITGENSNLELLTLEEAGKLLKNDPTTIGRMIQRGEIAAVRYGRSVRIRRQDLEEFIKSHLEGRE